MQILTHDVMEDILNFYLLYKIQFEIIIRKNKAYIKFTTGNIFRPNVLLNSNNLEVLWLYFNITKFIVNFTTKIDKILKDVEI